MSLLEYIEVVLRAAEAESHESRQALGRDMEAYAQRIGVTSGRRRSESFFVFLVVDKNGRIAWSSRPFPAKK